MLLKRIFFGYTSYRFFFVFFAFTIYFFSWNLKMILFILEKPSSKKLFYFDVI